MSLVSILNWKFFFSAEPNLFHSIYICVDHICKNEWKRRGKMSKHLTYPLKSFIHGSFNLNRHLNFNLPNAIYCFHISKHNKKKIVCCFFHFHFDFDTILKHSAKMNSSYIKKKKITQNKYWYMNLICCFFLCCCCSSFFLLVRVYAKASWISNEIFIVDCANMVSASAK